jgi:ABC-2 type transport system permease protein
MGYHLRLVWLFIRTSLQREVAFRANFFINILHTALNLLAGIAGVAILFGQVETFHGWTFGQALVLLGIYLLVGALQRLFIRPGLDTLAGMEGEIWEGRFDFTLLKPVDTQFLVSFRSWRPWAAGDTALSLVVLGVGLARLEGRPAMADLAGFLVALVASITIVYAVLLLLTSGIFWYQGAPLTWVFDSVIQLGRYPVGIYPGWLRLLLSWVVPVGFITTVPAEALTGQVSALELLGGAALAAALLVAASRFFRLSLRRYSSASS